ncbi:hypothetical protein Vadar_011773 [Vaccinium darrowii]|uniref:Uncharacterized protein n=1 Tax=Vaccinium darrowii TaxID=229202 RepID=A0ACB7YL51_9ERIC|nr:hypothetical protein Vadar_011773 [Vaccinium darrowii]
MQRCFPLAYFILPEFDVFESQECGLGRVKLELDLYSEEPRLERKKNVDLDILCYWMANSSRYPHLSFMARDILSIPITTVASESAFSNGGRIVDKYRSSIIPKNVDALLCTRDWQYNATSEQNIVVEDLEEEKEKLVEDFGERVATLGTI